MDCITINDYNNSHIISFFVLAQSTWYLAMFWYSSCCFYYNKHTTWVKVFRIAPEFRILRLIFHRKSASKPWIKQILMAFLIYFSLSKDNWSFKLEIVDICRHTASLKISWFWKFWTFTHGNDLSTFAALTHCLKKTMMKYHRAQHFTRFYTAKTKHSPVEEFWNCNLWPLEVAQLVEP